MLCVVHSQVQEILFNGKMFWKSISGKNWDVRKKPSHAKIPKQITILNSDGSSYCDLAKQVYLLSNIDGGGLFYRLFCSINIWTKKVTV